MSVPPVLEWLGRYGVVVVLHHIDHSEEKIGLVGTVVVHIDLDELGDEPVELAAVIHIELAAVMHIELAAAVAVVHIDHLDDGRLAVVADVGLSRCRHHHHQTIDDHHSLLVILGVYQPYGGSYHIHFQAMASAL